MSNEDIKGKIVKVWDDSKDKAIITVADGLKDDGCIVVSRDGGLIDKFPVKKETTKPIKPGTLVLAWDEDGGFPSLGFYHMYGGDVTYPHYVFSVQRFVFSQASTPYKNVYVIDPGLTIGDGTETGAIDAVNDIVSKIKNKG